jgi:hypothetical protein
MKELRVHAAAAHVYVGHPALPQLAGHALGRREGHVTGIVDVTQALPGRAGQGAQAKVLSVAISV